MNGLECYISSAVTVGPALLAIYVHSTGINSFTVVANGTDSSSPTAFLSLQAASKNDWGHCANWHSSSLAYKRKSWVGDTFLYSLKVIQIMAFHLQINWQAHNQMAQWQWLRTHLLKARNAWHNLLPDGNKWRANLERPSLHKNNLACFDCVVNSHYPLALCSLKPQHILNQYVDTDRDTDRIGSHWSYEIRITGRNSSASSRDHPNAAQTFKMALSDSVDSF